MKGTIPLDTATTMNFDNRTLFIPDNHEIMRGMDSDTMDLIYLDPPFNSNRNYKYPIGSPADGSGKRSGAFSQFF